MTERLHWENSPLLTLPIITANQNLIGCRNLSLAHWLIGCHIWNNKLYQKNYIPVLKRKDQVERKDQVNRPDTLLHLFRLDTDEEYSAEKCVQCDLCLIWTN